MKRHGQQVAAMLSNWESVEEALEVAENSAGSAEREFARATEGINFKLNQVANNMQKFWSESIDAETVRNFADILVYLSSSMANLAESVDMGRVAMSVMLTILAKMTLKKIALAKVTKAVNSSFIDMKTGAVISTKAMIAKTAATKALALSLAALKTAGIALAFYMGTKLVSAIREANKSIEEQIELYREAMYTSIDNVEAISEEIEKVQDLQKVLEDSNSTHEELVTSKEELAEIFPSIVAGYEDETGELIINNNELERRLAAEKELLKIEEEKLKKSAGEMASTARDGIEESEIAIERSEKRYAQLEKELKTLEEEASEIMSKMEATTKDSLDYARYRQDLVALDSAMSDLEHNMLKHSENILRHKKNELEYQQNISESYRVYTAELTDATDEQVALFDTITRQMQDAGMEHKKYEEATESLVKTIQSLSSETMTQAQEQELMNQIVEVSKLEFAEVESAIAEYTEALAEASDEQNNYTVAAAHTKEELEALEKQYADSTDKIQDYYKMIHELESAEGMSADTKDRIIRQHPELRHLIGNEIELKEQLKILVKEEEEAQKTAFINKLKYSEDFLNARVNGENSLRDELAKAYDVDLSNAKNLAQAKEQVEIALINRLAGAWAEYYDIQANTFTGHQIDNLVRGAMRGDQAANDTLMMLDASRKAAEDFNNGFQDTVLHFSGIEFTPINLSGINHGQTSGGSSGSGVSDTSDIDAERAAQEALRERERLADEIIGVIQDSYRKQEEIIVASLRKEIEELEDAHEKKIGLLNDEIEKQRSIHEERYKLLQEELRREQDAHHTRVENYRTELREFEDIVNAKIQELNRERQADNFSDRLSDAEAERLRIISEIEKYRLDDTIEGRQKVHELEKQLSEQEVRIERMKGDRTHELREQSLRDQMDNYRKDIEEKINAEEEKFRLTEDRINEEIRLEEKKVELVTEQIQHLIEKEEEKHQAIIDGINEEIRQTEWKYDKLINDEARYADMRKDIIEGNMEEVNGLLKGFSDDFKSYNEEALYEINVSYQDTLNLLGRISTAQEGFSSDMEKYATGSINNIEKTSDAVTNSIENSFNSMTNSIGKSSRDAQKEIDDLMAKINELERAAQKVPLPPVHTNSNTLTMGFADPAFHRAFSDGGVVDYTGLASVHGSPNSPEVMFNASQASKLYDYVKNMPEIGGSGSGTGTYIDLDINIDRMMGTREAGNEVGNGIISALKRKGVVLTNE